MLFGSTNLWLNVVLLFNFDTKYMRSEGDVSYLRSLIRQQMIISKLQCILRWAGFGSLNYSNHPVSFKSLVLASNDLLWQGLSQILHPLASLRPSVRTPEFYF